MKTDTIPSFSRVEITINGKREAVLAAAELRRLADELEHVADTAISDSDAAILAHHRIKGASKKLRLPS